MGKKISLSNLFQELEMMLNEHWGYILGASGVKCTENLIAWSCGRFPDNAANTEKYGPKWLGKMVIDCSGVPYYIAKKYGVSIPHGSNSIAKNGYISRWTAGHGPGSAAFKVKGDDYYHIGVVGPDGLTVYEAQSTKNGFTTSSVSSWHKFGEFSFVDYSGGYKPMDNANATITGDRVRIREGAGTNTPKIGEVNKGDRVEILEETGNWYKCNADGTIGYIYGQYVEPDKEAETPEKPDPNDEEFVDVTLTLSLAEARHMYTQLGKVLGAHD